MEDIFGLDDQNRKIERKEAEIDRINKEIEIFYWNSIKRLWRVVVNFLTDVVYYFKGLFLHREHHKPFIADLSKLKADIKDAPFKSCGIFEGVYDEVLDEIIHTRLVESNSLDSKTREILGNDKLVVLS